MPAVPIWTPVSGFGARLGARPGTSAPRNSVLNRLCGGKTISEWETVRLFWVLGGVVVVRLDIVSRPDRGIVQTREWRV